MGIFPRKLLASAAPLMLAACATVGPPKPPSLELPKPPSDLRAVRKGDKVTLTWTIPTLTTDRETVRNLGPTRICRGVETELTQCGTPVGEAEPAPAAPSKNTKHVATYSDSVAAGLQQSSAPFVTYAVEVLNQGRRSAGLSNQVRVPSIAALPPLSNFAAEVTGQGVRITWTPPPTLESAPNLRRLFRLYRRLEGSTSADKIGDLDLKRCGASAEPSSEAASPEEPAEACPASYLDRTFEWEKTYSYHGTVVTVIAAPGQREAEVEGDDTPEAKVFADDVFPPAEPSGLQVVFSGQGPQPFIDLIWAPVADADLDGYNVYRHEEGGAPVKINPQPVKTPAYRDMAVASGKTYSYSISAVDVRGNESVRSEESSERVP